MSETLHMLRTWGSSEPNERSLGPAQIQEIVVQDVETLGRLFWQGFGHGDADSFDSAADAEAEVRATLAGKWGPIVSHASLVGRLHDEPAAASIVVRDDAHQLRPLLAFLVTDPSYQRRGLGTQLVRETIVRLDTLGVRELHLAVDRDNPARRLYERLGFHQR